MKDESGSMEEERERTISSHPSSHIHGGTTDNA
jgi:hypothetical protein